MHLRFTSLKGFAAVWRNDFIGHQGLLLPFLHQKEQITLGRQLEIDISVEGDSWGRIWAVAAWKNLFGTIDENIPRGVFVRIVKMEPEFERRLGAMIS
jgi:hypothetical protein